MKKKFLLSSILTIALCLSLIAGSTFALFTDTTDFNIAVTSGDVEVYASAEIVGVYSAEGFDVADDEFTVDEYGNTYRHVEQENKYVKNDGKIVKGVFSNGGTAVINGANLVISRITPGDRVDVDIVVDNRSDVAIQYRYKIVANDKDTNLATGMVVTVEDDTPIEGLATYTSEWFTAGVVNGDTENPISIENKLISIELPVYAGNEYQSEKEDQQDGRLAGEQNVEYTITVEAIQSNAVLSNDKLITVYPATLASKIEDGGDINGYGATVEPEKQNYVSKDIAISNMTLSTENLTSYSMLASNTSSVTLDDGAVLDVSNGKHGIHVMHRDRTITVNDGAKVVASGANSYGIFFDEMDNATLVLNGEELVEATDGAYGIVFSDTIYESITIYAPAGTQAYYEALILNNSGLTINWIAI